MTLSLLGRVVAGEMTEQALCLNLAHRFRASAAGYLRLEPASACATITLWSPLDDLTGTRELVERMLPFAVPWLMRGLSSDPRPTCLSDGAYVHGAPPNGVMPELLECADIAQVPLNHGGPADRAAVLMRPQMFDRRELHLLGCLREPISALARLIEGQGFSHPQQISLTEGYETASLTTREIEVLKLVAQGLLATSIASRLGLSPRTVHKHLGNIYRKLDAHDRLIAVRRAEAMGVLSYRTPPRHRSNKAVVLTIRG